MSVNTNDVSSKKHAMLIMAHNQFDVLKKLMIMLDDKRNHLYIHIDKKNRSFKQDQFDKICKKSKVIFIPRMSVYWGDSSQVECELRLIKAAIDSEEDYLYLHLLSGVDLQIKKTPEIHRFFDQHPQNQFIALRNVMSGVGGLSRYYLFMPLRYYNKYLAKLLDIISAWIQNKIKVNRLSGANFLLCKSQQWFSITKECAVYVLSQKEFIDKLCKYTSCSDEMFLGTVIVNSRFKDQIYEPYRSPGGHMRLIDRDRSEGASPHTWTVEDWTMIKKCPYFWARKFDLSKDKEIIERVYECWK